MSKSLPAGKSLRLWFRWTAGVFELDKIWLLSLEDDWIPCSVIHQGGNILIENASFTVLEGLSGSPILNESLAAARTRALLTDFLFGP
jgi:hypothetical protein